jgi:hypothetical protein
MATTDYAAATRFQAGMPHTYTAMEHLALAMEKVYSSRGKTTLFGHDKELKSLRKFEEKLKDFLLALTMDGLVDRNATAETFRIEFCGVIHSWAQIFPNWPEAYAFAAEWATADEKGARRLINTLNGAPLGE